MLYDIRTTPEQIKKAGEWVQTGEGMADVEIVVDDSMLLVEQGDERMAWDTDGSEGTEAYLTVAPLDPSGQNALVKELATMLWPERYPPEHPWHDEDHVYWNSGPVEPDAKGNYPSFQWSAETIEWVADAVERRLA